MAMTTLTDTLYPVGSVREALDRLRAGWRAFLQRRADHAALARAANLGPRLRADMGLGDNAASLIQGWDGLATNGYLVRPRR